MPLQPFYGSPDPLIWRIPKMDAPENSLISQVVSMYNLQKPQDMPLNPKAFVVIGFNCDEGIRREEGRQGAINGPDAVRRALARLPIHKYNFQLWDAGNIICVDKHLEEAQEALGEAIAFLFKKSMIPIVLGGGHETAWGHYQGIVRAYPDKHLGIINFDSHFDLNPLLPDGRGSSHTSFLQIAKAHYATKNRFDYNCIGIQHTENVHSLFEVAKQYQVKTIWADELHQGLLEKCIDFIDRIIDQNELIYVSLCLDVFSSAFAPGVSDPQPLGLFPWHIIPLIRQLTASAKVISYEVSDLSPNYDLDQNTAKLAACLVYEFIHHYNEQPRSW